MLLQWKSTPTLPLASCMNNSSESKTTAWMLTATCGICRRGEHAPMNIYQIPNMLYEKCLIFCTQSSFARQSIDTGVAWYDETRDDVSSTHFLRRVDILVCIGTAQRVTAHSSLFTICSHATVCNTMTSCPESCFCCMWCFSLSLVCDCMSGFGVGGGACAVRVFVINCHVLARICFLFL